MTDVPREIAVFGILVPPLLVAGVVGVLAAAATAHLLDRARLTRFLASPPLVFLCLAVLYTVLVARLFVPS